jgi:hypothetical protein
MGGDGGGWWRMEELGTFMREKENQIDKQL